MMQQRLHHAFSLLELSVVMIVLSLVAAFGIQMGAGALEAADRVTTQERLNTIKIALDNFAKTNGFLPCPATRAETPASHTNFGVEARTSNYASSLSPTYSPICSGTAPGFVAIGVSGTSAGTVFIGAVPVRTLNLPDHYAGDAWGNKFTYAVSAPHTGDIWSYARSPGTITIMYGNRNGTRYSITTATTNTGDPTTTTLTPNLSAPTTNGAGATYAVVSHGPDGRGAFPLNGTAIATGKRCVPTSDYESPEPCHITTALTCNDIENCDDGTSGLDGTLFYDTNYYNGSIADEYFDDYIVWGSNALAMTPIDYDYYSNAGECGALSACDAWCAPCTTPYPTTTGYQPPSLISPMLCKKVVTSTTLSACEALCAWGGVKNPGASEKVLRCP